MAIQDRHISLGQLGSLSHPSFLDVSCLDSKCHLRKVEEKLFWISLVRKEREFCPPLGEMGSYFQNQIYRRMGPQKHPGF